MTKFYDPKTIEKPLQNFIRFEGVIIDFGIDLLEKTKPI